MNELFEDFRDLLVELHDAGAEFVVGGHAVACHGAEVLAASLPPSLPQPAPVVAP